MWEDIILMAIGNGLWAVLSCVLLAYLVKDSKKREAKFTTIIDELADRLKAVTSIQDSVKHLNTKVDMLTVTKTVERAVANRAASIRGRKSVGGA